MKITSILALVLSFLFSCSPDKVFLHPSRRIAKNPQHQYINGLDTFLVSFTQTPYQPVFTKPDGQPAQFPFTIRSMVFSSTNGHLLNGWIIKPVHATPEITLIYFHGNSGHVLSNFKLIQPLVEQQFQVFMVDYSGFGFSQGHATRQNTLTDALSTIDFVAKLPMVKNTKLVIYGQSYGGHLSGVAGTIKQDLIDGMVIEAAFSSHHDAMTGFLGWIGKQVTHELFSAKDSLPNFHKPLLIIHSSNDEVVPF